MAARTPIRWPRQYAADIWAEPDLNRRRLMLNAVPEHLRAMVAFHVKHSWRRGMRPQGRAS